MTTSLSQRARLLAALLALNGATGFVGNTAAFYRFQQRSSAVAFRPPPLFALVFGPDGEKMDDEEWDYIEDKLHTLEETGASLGMSELTEEQKASLARMAAAFSPPGHKVRHCQQAGRLVPWLSQNDWFSLLNVSTVF